MEKSVMISMWRDLKTYIKRGKNVIVKKFHQGIVTQKIKKIKEIVIFMEI